MVLRRQTVSGVDHKNHRIRLGHRLPGLLGHFFEDAAFRVGLETAGIDDDEFVLAQFGIAVVAIPGEARVISHDGVTCFGDAVEQRGFAHVGATHDSDDWFHKG